VQRYDGFGNCARLLQIIVSDGCDTLSFLRQNPHKALNPVVSGNEKRLPGGKPKLIRRIIVKDIRNSSAVP
jgi:hypothetical protein